MKVKAGDILIDPVTDSRVEVKEIVVSRKGRTYVAWVDLKHNAGPFLSPLKDLEQAGWYVEEKQRSMF